MTRTLAVLLRWARVILALGIVYLLSHQAHPERWALDVWVWITHHVLLTIIVLLIGL